MSKPQTRGRARARLPGTRVAEQLDEKRQRQRGDDPVAHVDATAAREVDPLHDAALALEPGHAKTRCGATRAAACATSASAIRP